MIDWITQGHVSIPKALFKHYLTIGLNEAECMLLIHVHTSISEGNPFPTPAELSAQMSVTSEQCSAMLRTLLHKGVLSLEQHRNETTDVYFESYSLDPLWEKLLFYYFKDHQEPQEQEEDLFSIFEREFGRPLSPIECESLSSWLDEDAYGTPLIKAALKEAVMAGILNFRYIDRILLEWKKNGIKTPEQAKSYGEKYRRHQNQEKSSSSKKEPFPFYNWLEN